MWRYLDPRNLLRISAAYSAFRALAAGNGAQRFVNEVLHPREGERILDIGCGPGDVLAYMPPVDYVGFDSSAAYIETARRKWSDRASFIHGCVAEASLAALPKFDTVLALGIVHHLDDDEARRMFSLARSALAEGGRLVTIDPCFVDRQSWLRKTAIRCDRGRYVRRRDAYVALAGEQFGDVREQVFTDLIRLPYTHLVMECRGQAS
jgi:SAM-dependent methyltransferase